MMEEEKQIKPLSQDDFENGMQFKTIMEDLEGRCMAAKIAYQTYVEILQKRYDAPSGQYVLNDWAKGFEPVSEGD